MAKLDADLPPHCQIKKRKGYADVYFMPHPKDRAPGWPPTLHLGRTDRNSSQEIIKKANETFEDYDAYIIRQNTGIDVRIMPGSLPDIITKHKETNFWKKLSDQTKSDYNQFFDKIEAWSRRARHPHISKMTTKSVYEFITTTWPGALRRQKYAKTVLSTVFSAGIRQGEIKHNLVKQIELERATAEDKKLIHIWTHEDMDRFVAEADERGLHSLGSLMLTGIEFAPRQADAIKMRDSVHYKDGKIKYKQQKTGKEVWVDATDKLRERYEQYPSGQMFMFINETTGQPWKAHTLRKTVREICDYLGLYGYVYAHLRHSQIYYLAELEQSNKVIAAITGHSIKTIEAMLDAHYLEVRNEKLANKGIAEINKARQRKK